LPSLKKKIGNVLSFPKPEWVDSPYGSILDCGLFIINVYTKELPPDPSTSTYHIEIAGKELGRYNGLNRAKIRTVDHISDWLGYLTGEIRNTATGLIPERLKDGKSNWVVSFMDLKFDNIKWE